MAQQYRFAAYALMFNTGKWILKMLENCGPHVEKIYIAYSKYPWTYNPRARKVFLNKDTPDILKQSPYYSKIHLIEGVWDRDEEQRNACLDQARKDGIDFLFIQDSDEFYTDTDYRKMIQTIAANPEYEFYKVRWYSFWKSFDYVLEDQDGVIDSIYPEIAVNCKKVARFKDKRIPEAEKFLLIDAICYHGTYVLTDQEVYEKISTWSHADHFDRTLWFVLKWLAWKPEMKNLHPSKPKVWRRARHYDGVLPEVLKDLRNQPIQIHQNFFQVLWHYVRIVLSKHA